MAPGMTEKGVLPVGVEFEGKTHREFEIRPRIVADSIDSVEDERARRNESYLGLCVLARQLVRLGGIPREKITPELLMGMFEVDLEVINEASGRLQRRLLSFRDPDKAVQETPPGDGQAGVQGR